MNLKSTFYILILISLSTLVIESGFARDKVDKNTDKLNKKLRIVNEKGEINEYKASLTEVLITKNEAKAMKQLNKLLRKYKGSPLEPGLLYRKAELYVRQAKSARFFEFNRAEGNLLTLIPKTMKSATSKGKLKRAVDIYEEIERRYPNYSELDSVLFNNGFLRQQLNEDPKAEKLFRKLLARFPQSILVPDTHLALAEMLYEKRRYKEALVDYIAIKKYPLARVYPYAIYKTGWTKYQLKNVRGAMEELELVISVTEKIAKQENSKINLKNEALHDLVIFYPEAKLAKDAYDYFQKFAGNETGEYIISLSKLYARHSKFKELEIVLNDLISNMPESVDTSLAYKMIIESDMTARNYEKATEHLAKFESHCLKYFKQSYNVADLPKDSKQKIISETDDDDIKSCPMVLAKQSLKLSVKWHKEWKNKHKKSTETKLDKADLERINDIADATELAYSIYLRSSQPSEKKEIARFNYAELLFQRKKHRLASEEYHKVALSIKDKKLMHHASYYSIVSLEAAVGDKWSDEDEKKYAALADLYAQKNPKGKYVQEVKYKKAFIAYEKGRYKEAMPIFKNIGWTNKGNAKLIAKSQDLYLDILNIQKAHKELIEATDHLMRLKLTPERKDALLKINRESQFALGNDLEKKGKFSEAVEIYNKFAHENKNSKLADKAMWNLTQILIKQNKMKEAADKSFELYKMFPKSEFAKNSLQKAAELYEYMADTPSAAEAVKELAKVDSKNSLKWQKLSGDLYILSNDFKRGVEIYKEVLKVPDSKMRKDVVAALTRLDTSNIYSNNETKSLIVKYGGTKYSDDAILKAKKLYKESNSTEAFRLASQIVGDDNAPDDIRAQARFIQSEILRDEFVRQSVKTKIERIEMVLTLKTEKLDKAQRAYQSTIRYGDPATTIRAFYSLAKMYGHYVEALKGIQITGDISEKDKKLLMGEISNIIIPIEEKIADTLLSGIEFSKKYPTYDGFAFELRNELNRVNFKGLKFVKHDVEMPESALPHVN